MLFYILSHIVSGLLTFSDGLWTGKFHRKPYISQSTSSSYLIRLRGIMYFFWFCSKKKILSGHAGTNPGSQSERYQQFSICQWNINSIATHSFIKVSLLKVYYLQLQYHLFVRNISRLKHTIWWKQLRNTKLWSNLGRPLVQ